MMVECPPVAVETKNDFRRRAEWKVDFAEVRDIPRQVADALAVVLRRAG